MLPKFIIFSLLIASIISIFVNRSNNVTIEIVENEKDIKIPSDIKLINVSSNIREYMIIIDLLNLVLIKI